MGISNINESVLYPFVRKIKKMRLPSKRDTLAKCLYLYSKDEFKNKDIEYVF
jgi:hypothetical protein